jgi:hypothetical protein
MIEEVENDLARIRVAVRRVIDEIERARMGLTTDRTSPCLKEVRPDGQQECYLILSDEERAKGFVRPVRRSYVHVACGVETRMPEAIAETYARNPKFYGGTYCVGCGNHFPLIHADPNDPSDPEKNIQAFLWDDGTAVGS